MKSVIGFLERQMSPVRGILSLALIVSSLLSPGSAFANDPVRLAVSQRGNWQSAVAELGQKAGIFQKHGLDLDLTFTDGGGQTLQAVLSNSADIGISIGTEGVLATYSKGAPIRVVSGGMIGSSDLYWYVPAASPIKSISDAAGKTIAYSANGSSTDAVVRGFLSYFKITATPVATGGMPATYTQIMSKQIDVGWSLPPFGLEALDQGKIRLIATGNDLPYLRSQSVRISIASLKFVQEKPEVLKRFLDAYRESIDWMYGSDESIKFYAAITSVPEAVAKRARDEFYPKAALDPAKISGLDSIMAGAVNSKFITAPLSDAQIKELFVGVAVIR